MSKVGAQPSIASDHKGLPWAALVRLFSHKPPCPLRPLGFKYLALELVHAGAANARERSKIEAVDLLDDMLQLMADELGEQDSGRWYMNIRANHSGPAAYFCIRAARSRNRLG